MREGRAAFLCPHGGAGWKCGVAVGKEASGVQASGKMAFPSCLNAPGYQHENEGLAHLGPLSFLPGWRGSSLCV